MKPAKLVIKVAMILTQFILNIVEQNLNQLKHKSITQFFFPAGSLLFLVFYKIENVLTLSGSVLKSCQILFTSRWIYARPCAIDLSVDESY